MHRPGLSLGLLLAVGASGSLLGACGGDDGGADAAVQPDAAPEEGTLTLSWQISDGANVVSCEDVGALNVRVTFTPVDGGSGVADGFVCGLGTATTMPVKARVYTVEITVIGSGNTPMGEPHVVNDLEIQAGEDVTLAPVTFEVVRQGTLEFYLDTDEVGSNCATDAGGAGITAVAIELYNSQGECVPTTFEIEAGADQPAGTYTADCAGATYGCIEEDQRLRATGVPSGQSSMVLTGYKDVEACYTREPQFTVPGSDLTLELQPQVLARDDTNPACDPYALGAPGQATTR